MHDPMTVAVEIRRPWPVIRRKTHNFNNDRRVAFRHTWAKWYQPWAGWMCFWKIGSFELYWPSFITIWHVEPDGHDSGEVCKHSHRWQDAEGKWHSKPSSRWRWHIWHWKIRVAPLQHLRRWALTRCEWCGGRSKKGDYVNCSHQWDREGGSWWRGERGLFHADCSNISTAHATCDCSPTEGQWKNELGGYRYGECATCGKRRIWKNDIERMAVHPGDEGTRILASIPVGQRDQAKTELVAAMWREWRELDRRTA